MLAGPPFGGLLAGRWGEAAPFLAVAAAALAVAGAVVVALPRAPAEPPRRRVADDLLGDPAIVAIVGTAALGAAILGLVEPVLALDFAGRLGATVETRGLLIGAAVLSYAVVAPAAGALSDRLGRGPVVRIGWLVTVVALPLLAWPQTVPAQGAAMLLFGLGLGLFVTPLLPALAEAIDRRGSSEYGAPYALYNAAYAAGILVGPTAGGVLTERLHLAKALGVAALAALVAGAALLLPRWGPGRR
jgi:predicted MFS family arabinose efflux permease